MSDSARSASAFEPREWLRERLRRAPSWALSVAFHALALACLTLVTFGEAILARGEPPPITIVAARKPRAKVEPPPDGRPAFRDSPASAARGIDEPPVELPPNFAWGDHDEIDIGRKDADEWLGERDDLFISPGPQGGAMPGLGRNPNGPPGPEAPIGVGPGGHGGGRFGRRGIGGNENMLRERGGGGTVDAVKAGLRWLARHQAPDGGWRAGAFGASCAPGTPCDGPGYGQFDVGVTGLALLAFLGAGYTHLSRESYEDPYTHEKISFGRAVKRGIKYLESIQDAEGCLGPRTGEFMYNHSIAALAAAEAYGLTNAAQFRPIAQKGIDFLSIAQNPYRAWRYTVKPGDNDTSVTGWCVMALKSAEISGLAVPRTSYDGALAWIDSATDQRGEVGYTGRGKTDVVVKGKNEAWFPHPAMTAVGLLCRIFIERNAGDRTLERHAALILDDLPAWDDRPGPVDFYYWYYATLALYQLDGPDGRQWRRWNEAMKDALLDHQQAAHDGCAGGSWDPHVDRWGFAGGRVYATAINVLTLEVYYRYERVFGGGRGGNIGTGK